MNRPLIVAVSSLLVAALAIPGVAVAKGGPKSDRSKGGSSAASAERGKGRPGAESPAPEGGVTAKEARKAEKTAAKEARKAEKAARKEARKAAKSIVPEADEVEGVSASEEPSGSSEPSASVEPSVPTGPGIANAMTRITANLEKSLAKMAAGKKKQLPPGLVRVWMKFAAWLGIDPTTRPGYVAPVEPTATVEPTSTVEPTPTAEPTPTVDPVEPAPTVDPTPTVEPSATAEPTLP